jgi:glycosyltransferase involved in cell wall biosynthesis
MGLRICQVLSGDLWAGAEVMAFNLIREISRIHPPRDLCVVLLNHGRLEDELRRLKITVIVIDEQRYTFGHLFMAARQIINDFRPDILHAHRYKENILALLVSKVTGNIPVVATQHGMPETISGIGSFKRRLFHKTLFAIQSHFLRCLVCVSNDLKEHLIHGFGFKPGKLTVIHNGIELAEVQKKDRANDLRYLGSAGRFFPVKDYPLFVDIAHAVTQRSRNAKFLLAGDGPEKEKIQLKIRENKLLDNVSLLGHVDDMSSFYNGLDIYLNTSVHEGIPMSILEAMSYGLPIIAPKTGGITEIVRDGKDGFLIDHRSIEDFSKGCLQLIEDNNLLYKMGNAAQNRVRENFSVKVMTTQYMNLYKELTIK